MKKAAVFNDLSGFGKCSLTAAIPVLSAQGVQCCPMASAVLTNQTGYEYHKCTDLTAMIKDYIDNWQKNNAHFDGIYSGFMTGSKQIELFMDFLDVFYEKNTMLLVDPATSEVRKVCLFVACLPFSRYSYVEPTLDMKQDTWLLCHVHAFSFLGGATPCIVPDNLRTGVTAHPRAGEPVLNAAYEELAAHYGSAVIPASS